MKVVEMVTLLNLGNFNWDVTVTYQFPSSATCYELIVILLLRASKLSHVVVRVTEVVHVGVAVTEYVLAPHKDEPKATLVCVNWSLNSEKVCDFGWSSAFTLVYISAKALGIMVFLTVTGCIVGYTIYKLEKSPQGLMTLNWKTKSLFTAYPAPDPIATWTPIL